MDSNPSHVDDPKSLPACKVLNLQGCKLLDGYCNLDISRRTVSFFPTTPLAHELDPELFLLIDGDRFRLHRVVRGEAVRDFLRYDGNVEGSTPHADEHSGSHT